MPAIRVELREKLRDMAIPGAWKEPEHLEEPPRGLMILVVAGQLALGLQGFVLLVDERIGVPAVDPELHHPDEVVEAEALALAALRLYAQEVRQVLLGALDTVAEAEDFYPHLPVDRPDGRGHGVTVVEEGRVGAERGDVAPDLDHGRQNAE